MPQRPRESAADAVLTAPPGPKGRHLNVMVTSTARGLMFEGWLSEHAASGARRPGPKVRDSYAFKRVLTFTELLAALAWWAEARCEMLPERPVIEPGLPVPLAAVAAQQPGSLPQGGEGEGGRRRRKTGRKADPI